MPQIATNKKYTFTSPFLGPSNNLASTLDTDTVIVESVNLKASQQWYFTSTSIDGYYYFHTSQKGDNYCLDIRGYDGVDTLSIHFHDVDSEGKMKGQFWTIGEWSDGSARISNNYTGSDVLLDVEKVDGNFTAMLANADQNKDGQKWSFAIVGAETTATTLSTATATTSISKSTGSITPTSNLTSMTLGPTSSPTGSTLPDASKGLSGGAKGGIAVAAIAGVALLAGGGYYLYRRWQKNHGYTAPPFQGGMTTLNN